jgi:tyrosine-specific transport protein
MWSIIFWVIAGSIVYRGLEMAKTVQKILSSVVLMLLIGLSLYLLPDIKTTHLNYTVWGQLFFPYGIILFALHSSPAIIEAHALLPGQHLKFKRALILGTLIPMVVYILFVIAIVGVMGAKTSPIAMLGLGELYGEKFLLFGNLFAILAMSTAFVGLGIALKQTLIWDNKVPRKIAIALVLGVPLIGLLLGLRSFVTIINVVGGVFVSVQALTMTLLYWKAKHQRVLRPAPYNLHHLWLFITPVFLVFLAMTCYTVVKLLNSMV